MAKNATDEASSLGDLLPIELYEYALYIPAFEPFGRPYYSHPYRRYKTSNAMKSARSLLRKHYGLVKTYKFNFQTESWEDYND